MDKSKTPRKFSKVELLIATLVGTVLGAFFGSSYEARRSAYYAELDALRPKDPIVGMVICAESIPAGSILKKAQLMEQKVNVSHLPNNAVTNIDIAIGRRMPHEKRKGDAIYLEEFDLGLKE